MDKSYIFSILNGNSCNKPFYLLDKHMRIKYCAVVALLAALFGCATNEVHRVSEPGLEISGKKLYVLVNERAMHENLTQKIDSVWNANASDLDLETEFIYNEKLSINPVSISQVLDNCGGNYAMVLGMGLESTNSYVSVEYLPTMFNCDTRKVVWKMSIRTGGSFARHYLVKEIVNDFKANKIVRSK
jgi:hypothetical protein